MHIITGVRQETESDALVRSDVLCGEDVVECKALLEDNASVREACAIDVGKDDKLKAQSFQLRERGDGVRENRPSANASRKRLCLGRVR
jgi:hypothetical protein